MTSIAEMRAGFAPRTEKVRIMPDPALVARHAVLRSDLDRMLEGRVDMLVQRTADVDRLRDVLLELEDQITASAHEFTVYAIGRGAWLAMLGKHPPTKAHKAEGWTYNRDTFPPAALKASCVDPELTDEDAQWLATQLDVAEFDKLFNAVVAVNQGTGGDPKSVTASVLQLLSTASATTPADTASPGASS